MIHHAAATAFDGSPAAQMWQTGGQPSKGDLRRAGWTWKSIWFCGGRYNRAVVNASINFVEQSAVVMRPLYVLIMAAVLYCGCQPAVDTSHSEPKGATAHAEETSYSPRAAGTLTYHRDIAPIVLDSCSRCHRPGEIAPFPLLTYEDVAQRAEQIVEVTSSRYMPPWLPDPGYGHFADERRLTDEQIGMLAQWTAEGAAEGDSADAPPQPDWPDGWQLGQPDLIVAMPEPYELVAEGPDQFRNFVLPVDIPATRYVEAVEFRAGDTAAVHHATIRIDNTPSARQLDERDPLPGFGGMSTGNAHHPVGQFLGWTAGKIPYRSPKGLAWSLEVGTDFVLELHLQPTGKPEDIQCTLGLFFTEYPPTRHAFTMVLESQTMDIAAGESNYVVYDEYTSPVPLEVYGVYPHAHFLGKTVEGYADLPDGRREWLIRISDWDFNWQDDYRYAEPVFLPAGTTIAMRWTYDNSVENVRNPSSPPRRVRFGPNSYDEMADLALRVVARSAEEWQVINQQFGVKGKKVQIAGADAAIAADPDDAEAHYRRGTALAQLGDEAEALVSFRRAYELAPEDDRVLNNLGVLLHSQGQIEQAREYLETGLGFNPDNEEILQNLGALCEAAGEFEQAIDYYRRALELNSNALNVANNLAWLLATSDDPRWNDGMEAVRWAEACAVATSHNDPLVLDTLAAAYAQAERFADAIKWQSQAIALAPAGLRAEYRRRLELYRSGRPFRAG